MLSPRTPPPPTTITTRERTRTPHAAHAHPPHTRQVEEGGEGGGTETYGEGCEMPPTLRPTSAAPTQFSPNPTTPGPTPGPTITPMPSGQPTPMPSPIPTFTPMPTMTHHPTEAPTLSPTRFPTLQPSTSTCGNDAVVSASLCQSRMNGVALAARQSTCTDGEPVRGECVWCEEMESCELSLRGVCTLEGVTYGNGCNDPPTPFPTESAINTEVSDRPPTTSHSPPTPYSTAHSQQPTTPQKSQPPQPPGGPLRA